MRVLIAVAATKQAASWAIVAAAAVNGDAM